MNNYQKIVLTRPYLIIILAVLLTGYFLYLLPRVKFSSSIDRFFIEGDPDKQYYERAKRLFGNDQVLVIALVVPEGESVFTKKRMEKLARFTRRLEQVEGVDAVVSLTNVPTVRAPRDPETGGFKKAIEVRKLLEKIPETPLEWKAVKAEIRRNPLYLGNLVSEDGRAAAVIAFIHDFDKETYRYNQVVGEIKKLIAEEERDGKDKFYSAGIPLTRVEIEERMVEDLKRLLPLSFLLILVTLVFSFRQWRGVVIPLGVVLMITVWTLSFMELADIRITLVTMILPGLMLALGSSYSIHVMSEFVADLGPDRGLLETLKEVTEKVPLPVVVCAFTTMVGFASLILNRIPAIQDLGYSAVVGIFFSAVVALVVMPSVLMMLGKPRAARSKEKKKDAFDRFLDWLAPFNLRHRKVIFIGAGILVLLSLFGIARIRVNTDFLAFFPEDDPIRQAVKVQSRHLAGAAPFNIVLEADRPGVFKHPAMLKRVEELQRWAESEVQGIDSTLSIADFIKLLSQAFHQNNPEFYRLPDSLREVSQILFLYSTSGSPDDFAPYVTPDYSAANILIRSRLVGSTETNRAIRKIEEKAKKLFAPPPYEPLSRKQAKAQTPVPVVSEGEELVPWGEEEGASVPPSSGQDSGEEESLDWGDEEPRSRKPEPSLGQAPGFSSRPEAGASPSSLPAPDREEFPWPHIKVHVTGTIALMNKSADAVAKGQVTGLASALLAIFLVLSLLFLSPKIGLLAMLPNLFPIFVLFGFMGATGTTLNFSTSLIAAIALGIGVDDTIHYVNRYNQEIQATRNQEEAMVRALSRMGRPMIFTSVSLFFGFVLLLASDFVPIRQFGYLTGFTIMTALIGNLFILPSLLVTVRIVTLWDLLDLTLGENPAHYIKIFHGLTNHQAKLAVLMGYVKDIKDGEYIIREGEMGNEMFVVLKGYVNIVKETQSGEFVIYTVPPGEVFGEMGLLRHTTRTASARAVGDVKLFVLEEKTLHRLQKRYPKISSVVFYNITRLLSDRLQATDTKLFECAVPSEERSN